MSEDRIKFCCPSCGKIYQVSQTYAGRRFKCKQCQAIISVPSSSDSATSGSAKGKIRCTCSNCSRTFNLPPKYAGKKFKCPQCQQVVQAPTGPSNPVPPQPQPRPPRSRRNLTNHGIPWQTSMRKRPARTRHMMFPPASMRQTIPQKDLACPSQKASSSSSSLRLWVQSS